MEVNFGLKTNPSDYLIRDGYPDNIKHHTHHLLSVVGKLCVIAKMSPITKLTVDSLKAHYITKEGIVKAVDSVSFEIKGHESFGITGETASGKSTLGLQF